MLIFNVFQKTLGSTLGKNSQFSSEQIKLYLTDMRDLKLTFVNKDHADFVYNLVNSYVKPSEPLTSTLFAFDFNWKPPSVKIRIIKLLIF